MHIKNILGKYRHTPDCLVSSRLAPSAHEMTSKHVVHIDTFINEGTTITQTQKLDIEHSNICTYSIRVF